MIKLNLPQLRRIYSNFDTWLIEAAMKYYFSQKKWVLSVSMPKDTHVPPTPPKKAKESSDSDEESDSDSEPESVCDYSSSTDLYYSSSDSDHDDDTENLIEA